MTTISFTATRTLNYLARLTIANALTDEVPEAERYITGAAVGGDTFIGRRLHWIRPDAQHIVIVPSNTLQIDPWWLKVDGSPVTVIEMPLRSSYRDRNVRLVEEAEKVYGFPSYPEKHGRSVRSGTWQTIRLARDKGNFVKYYCTVDPYETGV